MSASTKSNLILDLTIFSAFLVLSNPHLTGNSIHEWLGISLSAGIITHLLFHWQWLVRVASEFFKKLVHQSRLNFVVDSIFFIAMTGSIFSGILISKDVLQLFGIQLNAGQGWRSIHSLTSDASLIVLGLHIAKGAVRLCTQAAFPAVGFPSLRPGDGHERAFFSKAH